jgi:GntR family transcriptional regulator/MocR family aminotransferase
MNDLPLLLDRQASLPLHRQLYDQIREAILTGQLAAGTQLPPGRLLAGQLGVSRTTVVQAYEQLAAEGYLEGQQGAGTFVATLDTSTHTPPPAPHPPSAQPSPAPPPPQFDFRYGVPDLELLPLALWRRLLLRQWQRPTAAMLSYGETAGWRPLREALVGYLARARAVRAGPDDILITAGSQQALDLIARTVLRPGERVVLEEPGYRGARAAFQAAGATILPLPVDDQGLDPAMLATLAPPPRLVCVTPSHQFPTGAVLPLNRRLALLAWAEQVGALIVEDDYDSEFRYQGAPLAALQGLDRRGRVFYLGTLSKSLFPALRLGYLVMPPAWREATLALKDISDRHSPTIEQATLAEFIHQGHYERFIRRLRRAYGIRRELLLAALTRRGLQPAAREPAGLHVLLPLPATSDEAAIVAAARTAGIAVTPGARYSALASPPPRLLLGHTAIREAQIEPGIERLARYL